MDPLKIALVSDSFPPGPHGGIGSAHFHLALGLKKAGCYIYVYTFFDSPESSIAALSEFFPTVRISSRNILRFSNIMTRALFFADFGKARYQFSTALAGAISARKNLLKSMRKEKFDAVILPDMGAPGSLLPRIGEKTRILHFHHDPLRFLNGNMWGKHSTMDAKYAVAIEKLAIKRVDRLIAPSRYMRDCIRKDYQPQKEIEIIPNCIDLSYIDEIETLDVSATWGIDPDRKLVFVPSGTNAYKGAYILPEILRSVVSSGIDAIFLISGSMPDNDLYSQYKNIPEIRDRIVFIGRVPNEQIIGCLKAVDIVLTPTLIESFGMMALEAQACGRPVVSFATGGIPELIDDGVTGILVPKLRISDLVNSTVKLLQDEGLCLRMGRAASSRVEKMFSSTTISPQYLKLF